MVQRVIAGIGLTVLLACSHSADKAGDVAGQEDTADLVSKDIVEETAGPDVTAPADMADGQDTPDEGNPQTDTADVQGSDAPQDLVTVEWSEPATWVVAGDYDVTHLLDLALAIPGEAGELVNLIVDLFYDPGPLVVSLMLSSLAQQVGPDVPEETWSLFEDALADTINAWLLSNSPDCIQDFFVVGQDLVQILAKLELHSLTSISSMEQEWACQGVHDWTELVLVWKAGCNPSAPGYAQCGRFTFSPADLLATSFPIDLKQSAFTCMTTDEPDYLIIDTHSWDISPGRVVLLALNELILPAVCGEVELLAWVDGMVDCEAVADGLGTEPLKTLGVEKVQVQDACQAAVETMTGPIHSIVADLVAPAQLKIHGKSHLTDHDGDFVVDELTDGLWWGSVVVGQSQGGDLEGEFAGVKLP